MIQSAVIRSYTEERERAKMPGYVCTYDDYDGGDFEEAFTGSVRAHGSHGPRPTHMETAEVPADRRSGFGAGVF